MNANAKSVAAEPETAVTREGRKARPRALRPAAKAEKLVCRYCGSDDLAPSFRKRHDARCREAQSRFGRIEPEDGAGG